MKKLFIGLLLICSVVSMTACGSSNNTKETSSVPVESSEPIYESFTWPTSDIAKLLPVPKSSIGKVDWEASYGFVIYVAETTKTDYDEYVSLCEEAGFTVGYNKGDDYFRGDNADGYHISLSYDEGDVMFVRIDEPKEGVGTTVTEPDETNNPVNEDTSNVTPEFKELMDSYEVFFDEYVEFMKKYKESDDQAAMMTDMSEYMTKYSDMMSKLEEVKNSELSAADSAYYLEVSGRIMKKLAEIA